MIAKPMDVLTFYQVRKSKKQKSAFITAVADYAKGAGYTVCVEKGSLGSRNVIIGDTSRAKYLVTAHYDTCAWMPVPNFITPCNLVVYLLYQILITLGIFAVAIAIGLAAVALLDVAVFMPLFAVSLYGMLVLMMAGPANRHTANDNTSGVVTVLEILSSMPDNLKDRAAFVLFDLEEAGLIGSASYRSRHRKQIQNQIVVNLDCVGDGDQILMFPTKRLRKDNAKMAQLSRIEGIFGSKKLRLHRKGFAFAPSDQMNFPYGLGVMAFHRNKLFGLYCDKIHTHRDRVLEHTNVNLLRAAIISLIGSNKE